MSEPIIVPMPPAGEAPPMKAAAMASSSNRLPACGVAERSREAKSMPASAVRKPIDMKTKKVIRLTLTPLSCRRLGIAADGVDVPAEHRLRRHEMVDADHDQHDHDGPREAVVARQDPGNHAEQQRQQDQLQDEQVGRQHFEAIGLLLPAAADLAEDEQHDGERAPAAVSACARRAGTPSLPRDVGNVAVADALKILLLMMTVPVPARTSRSTPR